jgi:hypothetical protein
MTSNLRMSFAEWLFRMAQAKVPYQARALAVHAAVFKITGNDDLARLAGMDSKGKADQTFNRWKRFLLERGWVIIENTRGGRGHGLAVHPAYRCALVEFTDLTPRDPCKFNPPLNVERGVEKTPVYGAERGVRKTMVTAPERGVEITERGVEKTPVSSRARMEGLPSEVVIYQGDNPPLSPLPTFGHAGSVAFENGRLTLLNGLRQYWLDRFGGDAERLDLALIQAAGYVQENTRRPLEAQVSAQLARACADKLDRDKRYAAAAQRGAGDRPKEGRTARLFRIGAELEASRKSEAP